MNLRFLHDPETGLPHICRHGVEEYEVEEVLLNAEEDFASARGSRIIAGQTDAGRYLRVIFVPDKTSDSGLVVTAYQLKGNDLAAFRRRRKRKNRS